MIGIYKITNLINQKIYIGQSKNIEKRWKSHLERYKTYNQHLYLSMRKYGINNFKFEIIENCEKEELNKKEKYFINLYQSYSPEKGYNMTYGGDFFDLTPEAIKKLSNSKKGKIFSAEHREALAKAQKLLKWYTNGISSKHQKECPVGWWEGRTFKVNKNFQQSSKGKFWFTNGIIDKKDFSCPEGFWKGRSHSNKGSKWGDGKNRIPKYKKNAIESGSFNGSF